MTPKTRKTHKRTLLRNVRALLGDDLTYDGRPRDVLIEGDRIAAIVPGGTLADADIAIDLSRHLLVPGLVNGHQHSHEHFQRGRTENLPLELWMHLVRTHTPVTLTPRQVYLRTMIGAIESLRTGCTTMVDDTALGAAIDRERIDAALQAYDDAGIRALVGFAMLDKPIVDNFPFVEKHFPPALAAELRAAPRPAPQDCLDLVRDLARRQRDRRPCAHQMHPQLQRQVLGAAALEMFVRMLVAVDQARHQQVLRQVDRDFGVGQRAAGRDGDDAVGLDQQVARSAVVAQFVAEQGADVAEESTLVGHLKCLDMPATRSITTIITSVAAISTPDTAAARTSRLDSMMCHMRIGSTSLRASERNSDTATLSNEYMKPMNAPAAMPREISGSVTVRNTYSGEAPSECALSSRLASICIRLADVVRRM